MNSHLFEQLILGPTMLMISLAFILYPPKKINGFYGYRTPRSMKSQEAWKEGNHFGARMLMYASLLTCTTQGVTFFLLDPLLCFQISAAVLVVGLLAGIVLTELHLKQKGF